MLCAVERFDRNRPELPTKNHRLVMANQRAESPSTKVPGSYTETFTSLAWKCWNIKLSYYGTKLFVVTIWSWISSIQSNRAEIMVHWFIYFIMMIVIMIMFAATRGLPRREINERVSPLVYFSPSASREVIMMMTTTASVIAVVFTILVVFLIMLSSRVTSAGEKWCVDYLM